MKHFALSLIVSTLIFFCNAQQIPKWKITDVEKYVAASDDDVIVINMWATFCKPCVAELPAFIKITDTYNKYNVKLLLVSLDLPSFYPKKIEKFADKHNFNTNIVWLDETNADYFCPKIDRAWSGSIPATLFINKKTGFKRFVEDEMSPAIFEQQLQAAIKG